MKVILRENVDNLGIIGDVVNVSNGYARNFLLPKNLVVVANEDNVSELKHYKAQFEKRRLAQKQAAQELADKIAEFSCTIAKKVGKNDKLFGSVTSSDIADEMKKAGYEIKKNQVQLKDPIKTLGVHPVTVKLQPDVSTTVKVWITKEE